jgi:glycosyltransferase involved in cell wall biosynthesis
MSPLQRVRTLRRCIGTLAPDTVLSFLTKINVQTLSASVGLGVPVIVSERNNPFAQAAHPAWRFGQTALMPLSSAIVMQTERARSDLPARLRRRAIVIPNPCAPVQPALPDTRVPLSHEVRIVAVGRLEYQKGFDTLLEAMAQVHRNHPEARLTVFGEGQERAALEAQRARLGLEDVVAFPGLTNAPGEWVSQADIFAMSSRFEGFPNALAEALVEGIPAVSFDCAYGPSDLIVDGETGLLVDPGDITGFAAALGRLVRDCALRASMRQKKAGLRTRLAPDHVFAQWDGVIAQAAA